MSQLLQIAGAILVLAGFAGAQVKLLDQRSYAYLLLNLIGSGILAYLALEERQWGFLLLEGVWAIISAWGLATRIRHGAAPAGDAKRDDRLPSAG